MKKKESFELIDGVYPPKEAENLLLEFITTKINVLERNAFSKHIRFNADANSAKKRIEELNNSSELIKDLISKVTDSKTELRIKSTVTIEFIDPK